MKHYYSIKKQEIGWAHFQSNPRCQILNELSTITSLERFGHPLAYSCGVYVPRRSKDHCRTTRQRRVNVTGCFAVKNPSIVSGRTVIVVDDVITSGATFSECAKVLRLAGAAAVYGIFLARTSGW